MRSDFQFQISDIYSLTTMLTINNIEVVYDGVILVTKGTIELDGARLDRLPPHEVVRRGVVQVFEGRRVFENLTVEENLVAGGHSRSDKTEIRAGMERVY